MSIGVPGGTAVGDNTVFEFIGDAVPEAAVTIFGGIPRADFEFFIRALAENEYLRLLANPTLVALSGEEAHFLAGGEFPVPVPQTGGVGVGGTGQAITIEYKKFGVSLSFRPIVLGDGNIRLFVAPEVSELSPVNAVTIAGTDVPTVLTRQASTTLELKSGQTFAMAGLIKNTAVAKNSRIPGLGDLPVLGPLFRSISYREDETELVVLVTASLVEPMSLAKVPPLPGFLHVTPNDWELYIEGRLEGKEPAKINPSDADWMKRIGLDRLVGPGAWESYDQAAPSSQTERAENPNTQDIDTQS
jgi:pilus assembly protein CpaC